MREKTPKVVVTFETTTDAIVFESESKADPEALPGRIIPVPSEISAGCGLSWCADKQYRETLLGSIESKGLAFEGVYSVCMY